MISREDQDKFCYREKIIEYRNPPETIIKLYPVPKKSGALIYFSIFIPGLGYTSGPYKFPGSKPHHLINLCAMFEFLQHKVSETITMTNEEFEYAKTLFIPKKLRKKRFLLEEGEPCVYTTFVENGLLRSFTVDDKGNEHILQFGMQGWWVGDLYSFLTGEPSEYNIEALEDSELLLITKPSWDLLLDEVPAFERYFRILIQNNLIATQRRLMGNMTTTAEERYHKLLKNFPDISQRVPQHMIASYIGITRETLSRLRSQSATG